MTETTDLVQPGDMAGLGPAESELIVRIMQQNAIDAAWVSNQLTDSYKTQAEHAEKTLALVRARIGALLDGPYMPAPHMIEAALWPTEEQVQNWHGGRGQM